MSRIGITPQQVESGKEVYYYAYASKHENSVPEKAVIKSGPFEVCGTMCCFIDIRGAAVAISNLSFDCIPAKRLTARQRASKERYAKYDQADGVYDGISFRDFLKYKMYKD